VKTQIKLVTANDPTLFEQRMDRLMAELPEDATIVEVAFDTTADESSIHYSALLRIQGLEAWS
jgi:hypothetical protein